MFIAHLPAGYLVSVAITKPLIARGAKAKEVLVAGCLGAIAPDLDLLYFFLIDHQQHHHHSYWTHWPIVWIGLTAASLLWLASRKCQARSAVAVVFAVSGFVHILLDSIVGDIGWLSPWLDRPFSIFHVPALYQPWWLNFLLHWSFGLELVIALGASLLWMSRTCVRLSDSATREIRAIVLDAARRLEAAVPNTLKVDRRE